MGRSTVAAALGLAASRTGRKTLIAEMNGAEEMSSVFGTAPVGYQGGELRPGLHAMSITAAESTEEYLVRSLKFRSVYNLVFRNRLVEPFMDAVLGLSDLISVGKILDLEWMPKKGKGGGPMWDLIIVDTPATGHGLSLLRTPQAMMDITRVGPLFHNAQLIHTLLTDPQRTCFLGVTLAEEMPVQETVELYGKLRSQVPISLTGLVVNATRPPLFSSAERALFPRMEAHADGHPGPLADGIRSARKRLASRERCETLLARLAREIDLPLTEIPLLSGKEDSDSFLEAIASPLLKWL